MSRPIGLFVFLLLAPGAAAVARAEEPRSPLVEMRSAAEERADIEPDLDVRRGNRLDSALPKPQGARLDAAQLREAVRNAVRDEVARELHPAERPGAPGSAGRGNANGPRDKADKAQGIGPDARGASEQARGAAIAAQEARRNSDANKQMGRGMNNGNGNGPGKSGKP